MQFPWEAEHSGDAPEEPASLTLAELEMFSVMYGGFERAYRYTDIPLHPQVRELNSTGTWVMYRDPAPVLSNLHAMNRLLDPLPEGSTTFQAREFAFEYLVQFIDKIADSDFPADHAEEIRLEVKKLMVKMVRNPFLQYIDYDGTVKYKKAEAPHILSIFENAVKMFERKQPSFALDLAIEYFEAQASVPLNKFSALENSHNLEYPAIYQELFSVNQRASSSTARMTIPSVFMTPEYRNNREFTGKVRALIESTLAAVRVQDFDKGITTFFRRISATDINDVIQYATILNDGSIQDDTLSENLRIAKAGVMAKKAVLPPHELTTSERYYIQLAFGEEGEVIATKSPNSYDILESRLIENYHSINLVLYIYRAIGGSVLDCLRNVYAKSLYQGRPDVAIKALADYRYWHQEFEEEAQFDFDTYSVAIRDVYQAASVFGLPNEKGLVEQLIYFFVITNDVTDIAALLWNSPVLCARFGKVMANYSLQDVDGVIELIEKTIDPSLMSWVVDSREQENVNDDENGLGDEHEDDDSEIHQYIVNRRRYLAKLVLEKLKNTPDIPEEAPEVLELRRANEPAPVPNLRIVDVIKKLEAALNDTSSEI